MQRKKLLPSQNLFFVYSKSIISHVQYKHPLIHIFMGKNDRKCNKK